MRGRPGRTWQVRLLVAAGVLALLLLPRQAPGTVAEQRARLPPPAECTDGVEGTWRAHIYSERFRDWHVHTLYIRRVPGSDTELTGKQTSEVWDGGPDKEQPGPCRGALHYKVNMPSKGTIKNGEIKFWGTSLEVDQVLCGRYVGYNVDNFSGRIDPERQEFQSVNNDGGRAVNEPTVFRRIGCWNDGQEPAPTPNVSVQPPAFYPKRDTSGCGCSLPGGP
jgi:hypothetical protein